MKGTGLPEAIDTLSSDAPSLLRAPGRRPGRRPKLSEAQRAAIADEVLSGRHTAAHAYSDANQPLIPGSSAVLVQRDRT